MSGSSLDGVDLAHCRYAQEDDSRWRYQVIRAETVALPTEWRHRLLELASSSSAELLQMHSAYAHWLGKHIKTFSRAVDTPVQFVGVHGHTVFHRPHDGFTFQLGCGETLACYSQCPVVTNFRSKDLALGGVGAPLVPMGERLLFSDYPLCLNLGGIINLTTPEAAFDICIGNQVLNDLAQKIHPDYDYDPDGRLAREGSVNNELLTALNRLPFYRTKGPRTLDREWYYSELKPVLEAVTDTPKNIAATYVAHIVQCVMDSLPGSSHEGAPMLVSGGGRLNQFFFEELASRLRERGIQIAEEQDETLTLFKEAVVFGFLALLNLLGQVNVDGQVTGSGQFTRSGSIHLPPSSSVPWPFGSKEF